MNFSSFAALEVVILTTSSAASDEKFIKMTTFWFQCPLPYQHYINFKDNASVQLMAWCLFCA